MYKLVLCLRYLRRRAIAYFAVLGVALCVAMLLIVTSVMTGFVNKIERAARGLHGDIVLEPLSQGGIPRYDDLIKLIVERVDRVESASPRINSYGVLRIPDQPDYRKLVQITGLRLPEATEVTDFADGLFVQDGLAEPSFDPPAELMAERVAAHIREVRDVIAREQAGRKYDELPEKTRELVDRLRNAEYYLRRGLENIELPEAKAEALEYVRTALDEVKAAGKDLSVLDDNIAELAALITQSRYSPGRSSVLERVYSKIDLARRETRREKSITILEKAVQQFEFETIEPPPHRAIMGLGIEMLSFRTRKGDTIRIIGPGSKVTLYVFPIGKHMSMTDITPTPQRLTIVDDSLTDVRNVDRNTVYLPFEELQGLNDMGEQPYVNGKIGPPRCSHIQIKVRSDVTSETKLREVCDEIDAVWRDFRDKYGTRYRLDNPNPHDDSSELRIDAEAQTWRERQIDLISMIETQRTLMIVIIGIMSLVSVVLVFVIFYMIVVQKTRDIGVLKAIGASSPGVAGIFLAYGAVIGLVGSIIGSIGGYFFVRKINAIRDWLNYVFNYEVWTPDRFIFDQIPNEVDPWGVLIIIVGAIVAGVLGAVVPAIRAARMQPVEALRYE